MIRIDQTGKWYGKEVEIGLSIAGRIMENGHDLGTCFHELLVPLGQLAELPAAEGSEQSPQEHQHQ